MTSYRPFVWFFVVWISSVVESSSTHAISAFLPVPSCTPMQQIRHSICRPFPVSLRPNHIRRPHNSKIRTLPNIVQYQASLSMGSDSGREDELGVMTPAPELNPNAYMSVNLVGVGPGEDGSEAMLFLAPKEEVFLPGEGPVILKSFAKALPVPVPSKSELELLSGVEGFHSLLRTRPDNVVLNTLQVGQVLMNFRNVYSGLPFGHVSMREAAEQVSLGKRGVFQDGLQALASVVTQSAVMFESLVVDEVESLSAEGLNLGSYFVVKVESEMVRGVRTYADQRMRVWVPMGAGLALAAHLYVPVILARFAWQQGACRVSSSSVQIVSADVTDVRITGIVVDESQAREGETPQTVSQLIFRVQTEASRQQQAAIPDEIAQKQLWQLRADQAAALTEEQMRVLLRSNGIPCRTTQSKEDLLAKLMPLLDEVERKKLAIREAVEMEDFEAASMLQSSQSTRGIIIDEISRAVQEERYYDAAALQNRYEVLTLGRADVTAEEGSYDRFLDADEWYMESIQRSRKRYQEQQKKRQQGGM